MKSVLFSLLILAVALGIYRSSHISSLITSLSPFVHLTPQAAINQASDPFFLTRHFLSSLPTRQANMSTPRAIRQVFLAIEQSEGMGARVRRSIGTPKVGLRCCLSTSHIVR